MEEKITELCFKKMVFAAPTGETITFSMYEDSTKHQGLCCYTTLMCPRCYRKYKKALGNKAYEEQGVGEICFVAGCENEAEYIADFNENEVKFPEG